MAFTWDVTTTISGSQHSILLLIWTILGVVTDGTVTVQYPVFMEGFKSQYVSSIYVGDAICALSTACIGLVQGVGVNECINVSLSTNLTDVNTYKVISVSSPPLFSVTVYYMFTFVITCTCIAAFIWVNFSTKFSHATISTDTLQYTLTENESDVTEEKSLATSGTKINSGSGGLESGNTCIAKCERYTLFILMTIICAVFRIYHIGILQYACQSYTNDTYSLALRASFIVRSLVTPCALLLRVRSLVIMVLITGLGLVMEAYIICVGVMSPNPPLKGTETGSNIVVSIGDNSVVSIESDIMVNYLPLW